MVHLTDPLGLRERTSRRGEKDREKERERERERERRERRAREETEPLSKLIINASNIT